MIKATLTMLYVYWSLAPDANTTMPYAMHNLPNTTLEQCETLKDEYLARDSKGRGGEWRAVCVQN
jgi:hypothetical protein